jgi:hypothetical protein
MRVIRKLFSKKLGVKRGCMGETSGESCEHAKEFLNSVKYRGFFDY